MIVKNLIKTDIKPLRTDQALSEAMQIMKDLNVKCLPVVDQATGKLIGQIERSDLKSSDQQGPLDRLELADPVKVAASQHIFEAVRLMLQFELHLIPAVDSEQEYKGVVHKQDVLDKLTNMLNLAEYGTIITIELEERDFTLSEIVQLIEVEGAKILGLAVETPSDNTDRFRVSIKLNLKDPGRISATLKRYGYLVTSETRNDMDEIDYEDRAGELLHYLNI